jgi:hypothetical protein
MAGKTGILLQAAKVNTKTQGAKTVAHILLDRSAGDNSLPGEVITSWCGPEVFDWLKSSGKKFGDKVEVEIGANGRYVNYDLVVGK